MFLSAFSLPLILTLSLLSMAREHLVCKSFQEIIVILQDLKIRAKLDVCDILMRAHELYLRFEEK